jgi:hypothetical protein
MRNFVKKSRETSGAFLPEESKTGHAAGSSLAEGYSLTEPGKEGQWL